MHWRVRSANYARQTRPITVEAWTSLDMQAKTSLTTGSRFLKMFMVMVGWKRLCEREKEAETNSRIG